MCREKQVLLGMSGGTDSSVAAMLLQDAGYSVSGVTFRFFDTDSSAAQEEDARLLAEKLGIEHTVYDARELFREQIVDYFVKEYMQGRTPVPCTICNNTLKWPLLAKIADEKGIFHLATGHYVRKQLVDDRYYVRCGADPDKDQSFFLWGLPQQILHRMVLPLGDLSKTEVRAVAAQRGFERVAKKKDSLGVCFCPMDYHTFLRNRVPEEQFKRGAFVDEEGRFVGWHQGYPFYTVGQRRGLGIHLNRAVFVKEIVPESNRVVLAPLRALEKQEMMLKEWNMVSEERLLNRDDITIKIRYRKQANTGRVQLTPEGLLHVSLHQPLTAIAPGQAAAFYQDDLVLGGGIIL
ncbi:tRNA 2-thiouridine(34) synthase MnmA [Bacteroides sp. OttesenSCG-928-F21]|nr:tRNA 2-thiouridine(34) synthase MnmA [Bacteroides sp. OttesenSCG-928-F21]